MSVMRFTFCLTGWQRYDYLEICEAVEKIVVSVLLFIINFSLYDFILLHLSEFCFFSDSEFWLYHWKWCSTQSKKLICLSFSCKMLTMICVNLIAEYLSLAYTWNLNVTFYVIKVDIILSNGTLARAAVPSGASTGKICFCLIVDSN